MIETANESYLGHFWYGHRRRRSMANEKFDYGKTFKRSIMVFPSIHMYMPSKMCVWGRGLRKFTLLKTKVFDSKPELSPTNETCNCRPFFLTQYTLDYTYFMDRMNHDVVNLHYRIIHASNTRILHQEENFGDKPQYLNLTLWTPSVILAHVL